MIGIKNGRHLTGDVEMYSLWQKWSHIYSKFTEVFPQAYMVSDGSGNNWASTMR